MEPEVLVRHGDSVVVDQTTDTRYQLASVSKQFTAAAVLLLVEAGTLDLDDCVDRWVADAAGRWRGVTLHHLLTHTSGLGHWDDYPMLDLAERVDPDELLATFGSVPLQYPVGGGWRYSSPGYVLLAQVVQRAADTSYQDFLAGRLFDPLGLGRTFAGAPGDRQDLASGHDAAGTPVPTWELDVVNMGAGDVWSTAHDLVAWLDALQGGRLLSERHRRLMLTERARTGMGPDASGYGYGVFVGEVDGRRWWHHSGDNAGYRAFVGSMSSRGRRFVVLSNSEATDASVVEPLLAPQGPPVS